jgi:hypothetical protein
MRPSHLSGTMSGAPKPSLNKRTVHRTRYISDVYTCRADAWGTRPISPTCLSQQTRDGLQSFHRTKSSETSADDLSYAGYEIVTGPVASSRIKSALLSVGLRVPLRVHLTLARLNVDDQSYLPSSMPLSSAGAYATQACMVALPISLHCNYGL